MHARRSLPTFSAIGKVFMLAASSYAGCAGRAMARATGSKKDRVDTALARLVQPKLLR
jgi:hypothetical protein